jgi:hypothetical protein
VSTRGTSAAGIVQNGISDLSRGIRRTRSCHLEAFPHCSISHADFERNFPKTGAFCTEPEDFITVDSAPWTSQLFAGGTRISDARAYPLPNKITFQLGNGRNDAEQRLP